MKSPFFSPGTWGIFTLAWMTASVVAGAPISCQERVVNQPEMGLVTWCDVHSTAGAFSFIPPAAWRLVAHPAEGRLYLHSPDSLASVEVRFGTPQPAASATNAVLAWRSNLDAAYPGATIVEDFLCHTSAQPGHAFDLRWESAKQVPMAARVVLVPFPSGSVEFHLQARPENIKGAYPVFGALLTSFSRAAQDDGKPNR